MASYYYKPEDWGFQWDNDLAYEDQGPLIGGGAKYYNWFKDNWSQDAYQKTDTYSNAMWDWAKNNQKIDAEGKTLWKPSNWEKLDFNIAYNRYYRDFIEPALAAQAAQAAADAAAAAAAEEELGPMPEMPEGGYTTITGPGGAPQIWQYPPGADPANPPADPAAAGWKLVRDYTDMWNQAQNAPEIYDQRGVGSFDQWLDTTGRNLGDTSGQLSFLEQLREQLAAGPTAADQQAALDYAASGLGISSVELQDMMNNLTNITMGGGADAIGNQPGLSPEEIALRERVQRNNMRQMQAGQQKMLDNALGSSGSRARVLMQSDQYLGQIRDQELQYSLAMVQEDSERRNQNFNANMQRWGALYQAKQMTTEQFYENIRQDRSLAMQVTATEISSILQQNQQYLQMYQTDLQATESYIQTMFNSIQAQLGLDLAALEISSQLYEQMLAPWMAELLQWEAESTEYWQSVTAAQNAQALALQANANEAAADQSIWQNIFGAINLGLQLVFGVIGAVNPTSSTSSTNVQSTSVGQTPTSYNPSDPFDF